MLLRCSSSPFLHSFISSSPSPLSSLHLRRAFSDGHIPALHPSSCSCTANSDAVGGLRTELSFSIYNTIGKGGGGGVAPLASQDYPHQDRHEQDEDDDEGQQPTKTVQPDHPEVPLFLARGLGIDRIASGLFTAGQTMAAAPAGAAFKMEGVEEERVAVQQQQQQQDDKVAALDAQYKRMVDEQPGNALFLRNYAQFLHEVKGDPRRAEEYYSRAMLADPSDGEIMSQYAKLVWEVHRDHERCLGYFQKSVQAAPQNSHVLAAYASFMWEQDDDCGEEGGQGNGGAAPGAGQAMELASAAAV